HAKVPCQLGLFAHRPTRCYSAGLVQTPNITAGVSSGHGEDDSPSPAELGGQDCPYRPPVFLDALGSVSLPSRLALRNRTACSLAVWLMLIRGFRYLEECVQAMYVMTFPFHESFSLY